VHQRISKTKILKVSAHLKANPTKTRKLEQTSSFVAQRDHWIHAHRAACGDVTGQQRHG
jgi:hypothetical protein